MDGSETVIRSNYIRDHVEDDGFGHNRGSKIARPYGSEQASV